MRSSALARPILAALAGVALAATVFATPAIADTDQQRTDSMIVSYKGSGEWVIKALALLGLGERWHPAGSEIVLDALSSKDAHLQGFAVEALLASPGPVLRVAVSRDLLDRLVGMAGSKRENRQVAHFADMVLQEMFPKANRSGSAWRSWWKKEKPRYEPLPWQDLGAQESAASSATVAYTSTLKRAADLASDGIELALCLDSTGSMQPTIDATRRALEEIMGLLAGLSPRLRVGLVEYKDLGDLGSANDDAAGAKVLLPLSSKIEEAGERLQRLSTGGGGDLPERVAAGVYLALDRDFGWTLSAAKMLVVVGDAPPHWEDVASTLDMITTAYQDPMWKLDAKWRPGRAKPATTGGGGRDEGTRVRPIQTSCICTADELVHPRAASAFRRMAQAGGGVYCEITGLGASPDVGAATQLASHLIEAVFGESFRASARRLVAVYSYWRRNGLFLR